MMHGKEKAKTLDHYLWLASILGASVFMFLQSRFNKSGQEMIILSTGFLYVLWGIIHHKLTHFLTLEIVFEYILVASIGSIVLLNLVGF